MKFEGIYTPVITPYAEDGSIDRDAFVAMIEHLIAAGVHGIINGGSTGEYYAQSMEERAELATLARDSRPHALRIRELYLAGLSRPPSDEEVTAATEYIESESREVKAAYEDLVWVCVEDKENVSSQSP